MPPVFPVLNFSPETTQEANPWMTIIPALQKMQAQAYQNQSADTKQPYLKPSLDELLKQSQAKTQMDQYKAALFPQITQSKLGLQNAQTALMNLKNKFPLLQQTGSAGQLGSIDYLRSIGKTDLADKLTNALAQKQQIAQTQSGSSQLKANSMAYARMPSDLRRMMMGYALGAGIDGITANREFIKGTTLPDLLKTKGLTIDQVTPVYAPTGSTLSRSQLRGASTSEIEAVNPTVTAALAPYSRQFGDQNPKLVINQFKGKDPDGVARYVAASMLSPELSAIRTKALGGQVGIEIIKHITDKTYGKLSLYRSLMGPELFKKSQNYLDQWIEQAVAAANKRSLDPLNVKGGQQSTLNSQVPRATSSTNNFPTSFKSKADFNAYISSLSPQQKADYKAWHQSSRKGGA